jgi:glycerophosphoryl diester phosphodiesterase
MRTLVNVSGHRGCRGKDNPPENSLAAFKEAIRQGATGIELDVFLTTDRHLVVFHDDDLKRMTNGQGPIQAFTLQALERFRLKNFSGNLRKQRIPTLDQVLDLVDDWRNKSDLATEKNPR